MALANVSKAIAGAISGAVVAQLGMAADGEFALGLAEVLTTVIGAGLGYAMVWVAPKNREG